MSLVMLALWIAVGLGAGWLAGSLVGGIVWTLGISPEVGMVAVAGVAFVGAASVIVLQRKIWPAIA